MAFLIYTCYGPLAFYATVEPTSESVQHSNSRDGLC